MQSELQSKTLYKETLNNGKWGIFDIEIKIGASKLPDFETDEIQQVAWDTANAVKSVVLAAIIKDDPDSQRETQQQKKSILDLFSNEAIYVEEIPNGYCHLYCCKHLPWFVVTTRIGRFKVGSRKRVIQIEWSETQVTKTAAELFPNEDVTKENKMIHAWNLEDAKRYIGKILENN